MKEVRTACPRCGQDWLMDVRLVYLGREATFCPECEALWIDRGPRADNFEDYGTFMKRSGRADPHRPEEIQTIGPFRANGST
jgi:Zn-finger nucleic acid-binding protein